MQTWTRIGAFVGDHMASIAPACLVVAVAWPDAFLWIRPLVTAMFALITFQGSLTNDFRHLADEVTHPIPMLVSLGVSSLVVPVLAFLLGGLLFGSDPRLVCGIVLEYAVPVAVISVMWIGMSGGNLSLGLATLLVSTMLSPLTIPLTLQLLLGQSVQVDATSMMAEMLLAIALPAATGMLLNERTHGWGGRVLSPVLAPAARILLLLVILSNSTSVAPAFRELTPTLVGVVAFIGAFSCVGYLLGAALGMALRLDDATVVSMTFLCGMRNISAGAVIAAAYFPAEVMFPVIMGTLFQQVLAAAFGTAVRRLLGRRGDGHGGLRRPKPTPCADGHGVVK